MRNYLENAGPSGHLNPLREVWSLIASGAVAGVAAACMHGIFGLVHWQFWPAYVVIGAGMSLSSEGAELVWRDTVARMVPAPGSRTGMGTLIPFWLLAGGIGYVLGMLISERMHFLGFYDTPVRPLFLRGGVLGCLLLAPFKLLLRGKWMKTGTVTH